MYNATNYTTAFGPFRAPYTTNFTINASWRSSLTVIIAACADATCSISSMPLGCNIIKNVAYNYTGAIVAVCPDLGPRTYNTTVTLANNQSSNQQVNTEVDVYYVT